MSHFCRGVMLTVTVGKFNFRNPANKIKTLALKRIIRDRSSFYCPEMFFFFFLKLNKIIFLLLNN